MYKTTFFISWCLPVYVSSQPQPLTSVDYVVIGMIVCAVVLAIIITCSFGVWLMQQEKKRQRRLSMLLIPQNRIEVLKDGLQYEENSYMKLKTSKFLDSPQAERGRRLMKLIQQATVMGDREKGLGATATASKPLLLWRMRARQLMRRSADVILEQDRETDSETAAETTWNSKIVGSIPKPSNEFQPLTSFYRQRSPLLTETNQPFQLSIGDIAMAALRNPTIRRVLTGVVHVVPAEHANRGSDEKVNFGSGAKTDHGFGTKIHCGSYAEINRGPGTETKLRSGTEINRRYGTEINCRSGTETHSVSHAEINRRFGAKINLGSGLEINRESGTEIRSVYYAEINRRPGAEINRRSSAEIKLGSGLAINRSSDTDIHSAYYAEIKRRPGAEINRGPGEEVKHGEVQKALVEERALSLVELDGASKIKLVKVKSASIRIENQNLEETVSFRHSICETKELHKSLRPVKMSPSVEKKEHMEKSGTKVTRRSKKTKRVKSQESKIGKVPTTVQITKNRLPNKDQIKGKKLLI